MTRVVSGLILLGFLAGCGADGEPIQPSLNAGIGISASGVTPRLSLGLNQGPLSIGLGF